MIAFDWPWALAAAPVPLLVRWLLPAARATGAVRLPIAGELAALGGGRSTSAWRLAPLALAAWLLLLGAAAQPKWTGEPVRLPVSARDLLLAVDISRSMNTDDMELGQRDVTRLEAVQAVAGEFIARRTSDRVGLIVFGSQAYLYTPLSLDRGTVATLLGEAEVGLAGDATAIGDAIALAVKQLRKSRAGNRVVILLTDGVNTVDNVPPLKAAEIAAAEGVRVHTIAFGAAEERTEWLRFERVRVPELDEKQLQQIAAKTGGRYFRARDVDELEEIYALLDDIEPIEVEARSFRPTRTLFQWPLAGALALTLVLGLRRSGT